VKSILFVTHKNPQGYRIQQYFPFLEDRRFRPSLVTTGAGFLTILGMMRRADVTYIQRLLFDPLKLKLVRRASRAIVFDFDDAVMFGTRGESPTRRRKFAAIVAAADAVFGGNRFLCEEARRYRQDGVFCVPTVVDPAPYIVKTAAQTGKPTVGWIGSSSTLPYVEPLIDALLRSSPPVKALFKVVADKAPAVTAPNVLFEPWTAGGEKALLAGFDMGIMPLRDDLWSRGKCGLKLIQYMASGLPSLASPVGVTTEMIEDGVNGFLCDGTDQWRRRIEELSGDGGLRQAVGAAARRTVEERYSLQVWGPRVAEIIDSL
jgi:glycosyltransferase involved in cell wall biosynthesis